MWNGIFHSLYPCEKFSFSIPLLSSNHNNYFSDEDGEVYLRGSHSTANREGVAYSVIRIYMYVHDSSEQREVGATTISANVGLLCEIPYFFIRSDRYETFANKAVTTNLFNLFGIKEDNLFSNYDFDFTPTDELGDIINPWQHLAIGNEFVTFHIK